MKIKSHTDQTEDDRGLEARRLDALRRYGVLDTPSEDVFDNITATAAAACEVPFCAISLVDSDRLFFLSEKGLGIREMLRDSSFCSYATAHPKVPLEVSDATKDARFKDNPLVIRDLKIRFYAAQPLCTPEGYALGTLAVLSDHPKTLSETQRSTLKHLANLVMSMLEDRISSPASVIGRAVEDALPNGVMIVDPRLPGCPITFCNKGFTELTGYTSQEIVGKNCRFLQGESTDKQKVQEIRDAIENKQAITTILRNYKKDGAEFWNELTISPITDTAGNLNYYLGLQYDVSAMVQTLEKLASSNDSLQKSVDSHTKDRDALAKVNDVLVQEISQRKKIEQQSLKLQSELVHIARLTTMGEMATGLAHELNQPLLAISQCADTAMSVAKESSSSPDMIECIVDIQAQTQRAGEIIRTLRQFINRDTSKRSNEDINELVHQAIRLTKSDPRTLNIDVKLIAGTIPEPYIDRVQIAQVLVNLLRNSVDAISGIADDMHHSILVKTNLVENEIVICVNDTGPGIDSFTSAFKTFESSKEDGLGIGLSISRSIIDSHGGKLWVGENSSNGCSMCFSIPMP